MKQDWTWFWKSVFKINQVIITYRDGGFPNFSFITEVLEWLGVIHRELPKKDACVQGGLQLKNQLEKMHPLHDHSLGPDWIQLLADASLEAQFIQQPPI